MSSARLFLLFVLIVIISKWILFPSDMFLLLPIILFLETSSACLKTVMVNTSFVIHEEHPFSDEWTCSSSTDSSWAFSLSFIYLFQSVEHVNLLHFIRIFPVLIKGKSVWQFLPKMWSRSHFFLLAAKRFQTMKITKSFPQGNNGMSSRFTDLSSSRRSRPCRPQFTGSFSLFSRTYPIFAGSDSKRTHLWQWWNVEIHFKWNGCRIEEIRLLSLWYLYLFLILLLSRMLKLPRFRKEWLLSWRKDLSFCIGRNLQVGKTLEDHFISLFQCSWTTSMSNGHNQLSPTESKLSFYIENWWPGDLFNLSL